MKYWEIGPAIKALRSRKGFKQSELAAAVGISRVTLSKLENGKQAGISFGAVLALLEQLGMEIAFVEPAVLPTLEDLVERKKNE